MRGADVAGPPHPLREAGFTCEDGTWTADGCAVALYWDRAVMEWILDVVLPSGRQIRTRFDWQDLRERGVGPASP